jgi:hypothetical protein
MLSRWFDAGDYVLQTAAEHSGRLALAQAAEAQTAIALTALVALCLYFCWRGVSSVRMRGWTQMFWISGLALVFIAPAFFPKLTPARIDYVATFWTGLETGHGAQAREALLSPEAILFSRAAFVAGVAAFAALCAHDLAHRLREIVWEMGLIDDEQDYSRRVAADPARESRGNGSRSHADRATSADEGPGFGHRREPAPVDERSWALATLGLRRGARREEIERAYREKIKRAHPDHGGSVERAAQLNRARDMLLPHGRR